MKNFSIKYWLLLCCLSVFSISGTAEPITNPRVLLQTSAGDITLELDAKAAPKTVANFLQYVNEGFYSNTLFHRVIPDFMVQGGGFEVGMKEKTTRTPVVNESTNGLRNTKGTLAMARTSDPDSATSQFFINVVDNTYLNAQPGKPGYTVFGKVVQGMNVVFKISQERTTTRSMNENVPIKDVVILHAKQLP